VTRKNRPRICIDARSAQRLGAGVPRYCADLVGSLAGLEADFDLFFLVEPQAPTDHIRFPARSEFVLAKRADASEVTN
jgi:hypothetical protein